MDSCPPAGLPVLDNWVFGFGWIRWISLLLSATSESNSFIQLSLQEVVGGGRSDTYTFSYMIFSRFHHNNFRDTISWERLIKDDRITSFSLSKLYIDPQFRVPVSFPLLLIRCKTWFGQIKLLRISVLSIHGIHGCKEYRLSFPA